MAARRLRSQRAVEGVAFPLAPRRCRSMIPKEYRLDQVASRIAGRLEGARRSYEGAPERAEAAFRAVANEVLDDVIGEFRADGFADDPDRHAGFLRREVIETFLPRYTRIATRQTAAEARGFGLGPLHGPIGRVAMFFGILILGAMLMRGAGPFYFKFAVLVPLVFSVFLPDVVSWAARVRYRRDVALALSDMELVQDRALDYDPSPPQLPLTTKPEA